MRLHAYAIYARQRTSLSTRRLGLYDDEGVVKGHRWEWGIGKGKWKRQLRTAIKGIAGKGKVRAYYFVIGTYYTFEYTGFSNEARYIYDVAR